MGTLLGAQAIVGAVDLLLLDPFMTMDQRSKRRPQNDFNEVLSMGVTQILENSMIDPDRDGYSLG